VNELVPPIISVASPKVTVSTSIGITKLDVSCRAVQGKLVERKWEYIDGPPEPVLVTPSENGVVQLSQPGVYKFKYRCTDSFGGTALRYVKRGSRYLCTYTEVLSCLYFRAANIPTQPIRLECQSSKNCTQ
jgi:hypothetical protein